MGVIEVKYFLMSEIATTPLHELPIAVLDFETTGLNSNSDRVLQTSIVHVDGVSKPHVIYSSLSNPNHPIDPRAERVHGISEEMVRDAPIFDEQIPDIIEALEGRVVAAYNAPFDLRFLRAEFRKKYLSFRTTYICVMELRQLLTGDRRCKLTEACAEMGIPIQNAHSASADALATALLLQRYIGMMYEEQIFNVKQLSRLGDKSFIQSFKNELFTPDTINNLNIYDVEMGRDNEITIVTEEEEYRTKCETEDIQAKKTIEELELILIDSIQSFDSLDWSKLYLPNKFTEKPPSKPIPEKPEEPNLIHRPHKEDRPEPTDPKYEIDEGFFDSFIPGRIQQKVDESQKEYEEDLERYKYQVQQWKDMVVQYKKDLKKAKEVYEKKIVQYKKQIIEYDKRKKDYKRNVVLHNAKIDQEKSDYLNGMTNGVKRAMTYLLQQSSLPVGLPDCVDVSHDPEREMISVIRELPSIDMMPLVKGYKFVKKEMCIREQLLSETARKKIYDSIVYQIVLKTIYEVFKGDSSGRIQNVMVTGVIDGFNPANGQPCQLVLAECQINKKQYDGLIMENVEPQACFKSLEGKTKGRPANQASIRTIPLS